MKPQGTLQGKTALVTGGGYGIGEAIALAFAQAGANVVVAARSREALQSVSQRCSTKGVRAMALSLDVRDPVEVQSVIAAAESEFGRLDILVNNAGIGGPTALARDVTVEDWRQTMDVNLAGAFYCAKYASAQMIERKSGCIINIASVAGRIGFPHRTPYAASKWGLIGLSHSLAAELGPFGIRVNAILPGAVAGARFSGVIENRARIEGQGRDQVLASVVANTPLRRLTTEAEVAEVAVFLASDGAAGITGQALGVDGGLRMQ